MKRLPTLALTGCLWLALMIGCSRSANDTQSARVMPSPLPTFTPRPTPQPSPSRNSTPVSNVGNLNGGGNSNRGAYTPPPAPPVPSNLGVTMAGYNALREGMSYSDAVRVLGSSGTELSSGGAGTGYETIMYQWKASDGIGNMTAMFQNGRMINKAQFGLK